MSEVRERSAAFTSGADCATAKLFMHGGSQAVRLPKAFRFEGSEVTVRREGDTVILEAVKAKRPPTRDEMDAFWRRIDDVGAGLAWEHPERDRSPGRALDW